MDNESHRSEERRIVLAVRAGDTNAFGELVRSCQERLFNLLLTVLKRRESAEEVTQDAFVTAYQKLELYDINRPFYPWLATIGVRLALNHLRRNRLDVVQQSEQDFSASQSGPLDQLIREEDYRIWDLVLSLPAGERTAVFLVYRQELSQADAAAVIGVTTGTIKTLLFRARNRLRKTLDKDKE